EFAIFQSKKSATTSAERRLYPGRRNCHASIRGATMQTYEVTQKILSFGPTYEVRAPNSPEVLATVKGKIISVSPKLTMIQGSQGPEIASMKANFAKTKFTMTSADGSESAVLTFPLIALKKSFVLTVGGQDYKADGGFMATGFKCNDPSGQLVLEITKQL